MYKSGSYSRIRDQRRIQIKMFKSSSEIGNSNLIIPPPVGVARLPALNARYRKRHFVPDKFDARQQTTAIVLYVLYFAATRGRFS